MASKEEYLGTLLHTLANACEEVESIVEYINEVDSSDLPHVDQIRAFSQVSAAYDVLNEGKKTLNALYDQMSREQIPNAMRAAGVKTINVIGIGRVTISNRYSCSILDKDRGYAWLKEHGAAALITETVNSSTLAGYAKQRIEKEGKELPPDIFKAGVIPYTSITKG